MNSTQQHKKLVTKRKMTAASIVGVTFLFLLLLNVGSYFFVKQTGRRLEQSLDERLTTAASFASQIIEKESPNFYDPFYQSLVRITLSRFHAENDLEAVYLIGPSLNLIVDSRLELTNRSYIQEDSLAIRRALEGDISTSALHTVAGNNFKNVYAPLFDLDGNNAILVMEASAEFLKVMSSFRRGMFFGVLVSAALLVMITLYLAMATRSILHIEKEMEQSRRLAAMGQMGATMAHEIRNPLGIIKSTADVLREKYQNPELPDELFSFINEETMRLNRLVNDFLSLSRDPVLNREVHDLKEIVSSAISQFQSQGESDIELTFESGDSMPLSCDRDLLHQVILNLLMNSRQAIGDNPGRIALSLRKEKIRLRNYIVLKVCDSGSGFGDNPAAAFEPFYTTKTSGTGLGLAVSKTIVEKHGGRIEAGNAPEGGGQVQVYLPN